MTWDWNSRRIAVRCVGQNRMSLVTRNCNHIGSAKKDSKNMTGSHLGIFALGQFLIATHEFLRNLVSFLLTTIFDNSLHNPASIVLEDDFLDLPPDDIHEILDVFLSLGRGNFGLLAG